MIPQKLPDGTTLAELNAMIDAENAAHKPVVMDDALAMKIAGSEYLPLVYWLMERRERIIGQGFSGFFWSQDIGAEGQPMHESTTLIGLMHEMGLNSELNKRKEK